MTDWTPRFTDRARAVLRRAESEARRLGYEYVGTEGLLLGLLAERSSAIAVVLRQLRVDLNRVRQEVERVAPPGEPGWLAGSWRLPQTPRLKLALERAIEEARDLCHPSVDAEHLLLALLRDEESAAVQVIMNMGLSVENVRTQILNQLGRSTMALATTGELGPQAQRIVPEQVRITMKELDHSLERTQRDMSEAIAAQDVERFAQLHVQRGQLRQYREATLRRWRVGNVIDQAWLCWNNGTVPNIARSIRDSQRWQDLPVLADALEEAGCGNREMLDHCRESAEHEDRCWVVTLLLVNDDSEIAVLGQTLAD